jgi:hypothetical protein
LLLEAGSMGNIRSTTLRAYDREKMRGDHRKARTSGNYMRRGV